MADKNRKWVKPILIVAGVAVFLFVVLVGAAAVVIPRKYPPERIKTMTVDTLSKQLGRKVSVGDVQFSLRKGFDISDLRIGNRTGKDWDAGDMLSAKRIHVTYRLLPLLWLQVKLGEILLVEPKILVERRGLEEFNFSDLVKAGGKRATVADAALVVMVDTVHVQDGSFTYVDRMYQPAQKTELPSLTLKVRNISLAGGKTTFSFKTTLQVAGASVPLSASGSYRLYLGKEEIRDLQVKGSFAGNDFAVSGGAKSIMSDDDIAPDLKGTAKVDLAGLPALLPKDAPLPADLVLSGSLAEEFTMSGTPKNGVKIQSLTDATAADVRFGNAFQKPSGMKALVKADTLVGKDYVKVPLLEMTLADWFLKGSAAYTGMPPHPTLKGNPAYALTLDTPKPLGFKDLSGMFPALQDLDLTGQLGIKLKYSGKPLDARSTKMEGLVELTGLNAGNKVGKLVEGMTGKLVLQENLIEIPEMKFKMLESPTALSFRMSEFNVSQLYDPTKLNALIKYQVTSSDVNLENLLALGGKSSAKATEAAAEPAKSGGSSKAPAAKPLSVSAGLRLDGGMSFRSFYLKKVKFADVTLKTTLLKKVFKAAASVKGFEGSSSGTFQTDLAQAGRPYSFTLQMKGVQAKNAVNDSVDSFVTKKPELYKDKITGTMDLQFAGSGKGFDAATAQKNIRGNGTFAISGVRIKALALMSGVFKGLKDKTEELKMDRMDGTLAIADEKVVVKADSSGSSGKMKADGVIGFNGMYAPQMMILNDVRREYVDSEAVLGALPPGLISEKSLDQAADAQGFIPLDFKLTGAVNSAPGLKSIDLTRFRKNLVTNRTNVIKSTVKDKVDNAVQDKLKNIFKR